MKPNKAIIVSKVSPLQEMLSKFYLVPIAQTNTTLTLPNFVKHFITLQQESQLLQSLAISLQSTEDVGDIITLKNKIGEVIKRLTSLQNMIVSELQSV